MRKKRTDAVRSVNEPGRVGLLFNGPPGCAEMPFV